MFKRNYHYLVAGFPDIVPEQKKLSLSIAEYREQLENHLHSDDYSLIKLFFLPVDNINLLNLLNKNKAEFLETGNFSQSFLDEEIKEPSNLPVYMQKFIEAFKKESDIFPNYSWEDQLTWLYYDYVLAFPTSFLKDWFSFNLNVNNILAAYNIKKYKLPKEAAFIGDNTVSDALKKSTLKDFGLSNDLPYVEDLLAIDENEDSLEKERAIDLLRWKYLDELNTLNYFTVEVLAGFLVKLFIVERWAGLDPETGRKMFRQIISDLEKSYEFPKEFKINEVRKN